MKSQKNDKPPKRCMCENGTGVIEWPPDSGMFGSCWCAVQKRLAAQYDAIIGRAQALPEQTLQSYVPITRRQRDALEDVQQGHRSFYVYGPKGTGKTHLLNGTVLRAAADRIPSVILSVPMLLHLIREDKDIMNQVMTIPYLVLDDLGKQSTGKAYNWLDEKLYLIVDQRYKLWQRGVAHTSFTSQLQLNKREQGDGLENIMDPALVDRIRHMCLTIPIDGESQRGQ